MTSPSTRKKSVVDLFVNSINRDPLNSASSTDFRINIVNPPKSKILLCGLKSVTFPNAIYNISITNNSFDITDSSGPNSITISPGNYNSTELATALQSELNLLAVDTYTVSVVGDKYVFTSDFAGFTINPNLLPNILLKNLGFVIGSSYTGLSITAPNIFNIAGIKNVFIKIRQISGFIRNVYDVKYNFKFDITCNFGGVIFFSNESKYLQEYDVTSDNLVSNSYFDIQLVDEYGDVIDNNGLDWNFTLSLVTQNLNQP